VTHMTIMLLSAFPSGGLRHTGKSEVPMDGPALTGRLDRSNHAALPLHL